MRALKKKLEKTYFSLRYPGREKVFDVFGLRMAIDFKNKGIIKYVAEKGCYEEKLTDIFRNSIKPGMVVADIGANFGYYSLMAGRLLGDTGLVLGFEPSIDSFHRFTENIKRNKITNIAPIRVALSDGVGIVHLNNDPKNSSNASLVSKNVTVGLVPEPVPSALLDSFPLPDLIKIDVQGFEGKVLKGGLAAFAHARIVCMEIWPWGIENAGDSAQEILDTMARLGFRIETILESADESVVSMPAGEIVAYCRARKGGKGHVNIVFAK